MMQLDGLACATVELWDQATATAPTGDLVIAALGGQRPGADTVLTGTVSSAGWSGWSPIGQPDGGALRYRPSVAQGGTGRMQIAGAAEDGAVWCAVQGPPGDGWQAWQSLGQPGGNPVVTAGKGAHTPDPTPSLVSNGDLRLEIFVTGSDQAVWHRQQLAPDDGSWADWESLGPPGGQTDGTLGPLAVTINGDGRLEVFTTGINGEVQHCAQEQAGSGAWSRWLSLGHPSGQLAGSRLAVAQNQDLRLELFMVTADGVLWHRWQAEYSDGWSDWKSLGHPSLGHQGVAVGEVAVAMDRSGRLILFATAQAAAPHAARTSVWQRNQESPGGRWAPWQERQVVPGPTPAGPVEGPVLARRLNWSGTPQNDDQLILLLREAGTANIYLLSQQLDDVGAVHAWTGQHVPWQPGVTV
jgi:hypothetical protein